MIDLLNCELFNSLELQILFDMEWLCMRKKLYQFENFINNWKRKLQNKDKSILIKRITEELLEYEVSYDC